MVGSGSSFLDNIYEVASVSIAQTNAVAIGQTYVAKVTVSVQNYNGLTGFCLLYTSPSPRDRTRSRMPSSA